MAWAPDYLTLAALKAYLRITDTDDDAELAVAITAASRAIDRSCNRQFGNVDPAQARSYTAWLNPETGRWVIDIDDLAVAPTSIAIVDTTGGGATDQPITAYDMADPNAVANGKVWTSIIVRPASPVQPSGANAECVVTAAWGWPAVPAAVTLAAQIQANRFHNRRESPYGVAGSPSDGSELRLLARLDPDVAVSLTDYVRPGVVA
jgi:Phage QLRG family, putative DNA packaging.